MNRYLPIIFTLLWGLASDRVAPAAEETAVEQVRLASNHSLHRKQGLLFVDGQLFAGLMLDFDLSGSLIYSRYMSGLKNGVEVAYFQNGRLAFKRTWAKGYREGETNFWWPNGLKKSSSNYAQDLLSGPYFEWSSDGTLLRQFAYLAGNEEGPQKMWYEDGSIRAN